VIGRHGADHDDSDQRGDDAEQKQKREHAHVMRPAQFANIGPRGGKRVQEHHDLFLLLCVGRRGCEVAPDLVIKRIAPASAELAKLLGIELCLIAAGEPDQQ